MGASLSSPPKPVQPPDELHVFKGLDGIPMEYSIPEIPEKRKPTDQYFLVLFIVMFITLIVLTIYMLCYCDLKRITNGYDNCGNVCGEKNSPVAGINCTGEDFTKEKILMYTEDSALVNFDHLDTEPKECVVECDETRYFKFMDRCFKTAESWDDRKVKAEIRLLIDQQILIDLQASTGYILGMVFIALGICFIILLLFKYLLSIVVRAILITGMFTITGFTILLWVSGDKYHDASKWLFLIVAVIVNVGIILSWKKLNFVIRIFGESTKAVFAMPSLTLVPIGVFLIEIAITTLLVFLLTMYYSAGVLTRLHDQYFKYTLTGCMMLIVIYTIILFMNLFAFLHGCQQIVVAGAVSTWYFSREKDSILGSPVWESFRNLTKYHLGSVAFGSLVITVMQIIRLIVKQMTKRKEFFLFQIIMNCCIDLIEEFVHYISNQAYIMVAMHGQPFLRSGRRATKLLLDNALNTLSVNTVGDFVLWLTKLLVVILTLICGIILDDGKVTFIGVPLLIGGFLAALLAHNIFRNFEICVDTIFLCYCEDTFIHDGIEHPYYAPVELVAVVEEAKGVVEEEKMYSSIKTEVLPQTFV